MNEPELIILLGSLLSVALVRLIPRSYGQDAVVCVSLTALAFASPLAALWLTFTIIVTIGVMRVGSKRRALTATVWSTIVGAGFLVLREDFSNGSFGIFLGAAYFTLRHIHVTIDWWINNSPPPTLRRYARYHLFAPVLIAGPIHRLPNFERTLERRRWDAKEFYSGAERALVGAFLAFFVAEYLYAQLLQELAPFNLDQNFSGRIVQSAIDWVFLYIAFSGLTDLALGLSAMMGLKLEENFNRPYLARDLIDFWQRWHMTLSHWCRDYIYVLITSRFRSPVLGIFSAMVILGIWHETSIYYLLWAFWQALGIVLVHVLYRQSATISKPFIGAIARAGSFLWLILSQPVCMGLIEVFT